MLLTSSSFTECLFRYAVGFIFLISWCHAQEGDSCQATPNLRGTCVPVSECKDESREMIRKGMRPSICGFKGSNPIVCCSKRDGQGATGAPGSVAADAGKKAKRYCGEYKSLCQGEGSVTNKAPLVVGGEPADEGEFPHMAAIGYETDNGVVWGCGGALVSPNFVLTAAHCISDPKRGPARRVLLGTVVIEDALRGSATKAPEGQAHRVLKRIRHPDYKKPEKYNDIALLEIDPDPIRTEGAGGLTTLTLNQPGAAAIRPACLHYEGDYKLEEGKAIATGWGRLGFGEDVTPQLQKVSLSVLDNSVCNKSFEVEIRTTSQLPRGMDDSLICGGELKGGMDTCVGDSGGPFQVTNFEGSCLAQLIGVTSFGKFCGFENSPAVYTRVKHFVPWIESIVWP